MITFTAYRPLINLNGKTHDELQANPPDVAQYQGVIFEDGKVAIRWLTARGSTSCWDCLNDMLDIHGHAEYGTYFIFGDGCKKKYMGKGQLIDMGDE